MRNTEAATSRFLVLSLSLFLFFPVPSVTRECLNAPALGDGLRDWISREGRDSEETEVSGAFG
jgi:hypothetical protein